MFKSTPLHYIIGYSLSFLVGCLLCNYLYISFDLPMVLSSSLVGLLASLIFYKNKEAQASVYCGSFAGMSDPMFFGHWGEMILVSILGGVILFIFRKRLIGMGGKLGAVAFTSLLSVLLLREIF
ncbi:hypothetical protein BIY24_12145 [Halobacteriovorax marinus]|uniref:hypothetical protein n=1 Tax=Halobacteriovorax marinus TaxID=97084 RepID=UPI000BC32653|nr:hypothetical protein [Halobacteriovorax marinus]ATH08671.1 hypothetical protein BIY24_12145 [Halobacteriovorax marinus]